MFAVCRDPLPLSEACLHGLCASLNAPVVRTDELPPGPARAAIVTFAEEYGDLAVAVGIRALESGSVVVYRCREQLFDAEEVARAVESALGFAEGLGFLFDEDMIDSATGAGRSEALEHWLRLTGGGEIFRPGSVAEPPVPPVAEITLPGEGLDEPMEDLLADPDEPRAGASASELLLDDLMDSMQAAPDDELVLSAEPEVVLEETGAGGPAPDVPRVTASEIADPHAAAAPRLSKFRGTGSRGPAAAPQAAAARPVRTAQPQRPQNPYEHALQGSHDLFQHLHEPAAALLRTHSGRSRRVRRWG